MILRGLSWGEFFTGLGYLTGAIVFLLAARQRRLSTQGIGILAGIGFVCGILGARISELLASGWPIRVPVLAVLQPEVGGRALLGGILAGWIGVEVAKRRMGIQRSTGDLFALAFPAGEAVGRIGCFLNGCCYGTKSSVPWAVWQHGEWRHPAQIYSALVALGTFLFLLWLRPKLGKEGQLFLVYLLLFGATRFGLEFVRWRETVIYGLSPMQWFCLDLIIIGLIGLWRTQRPMSPSAPPAATS